MSVTTAPARRRYTRTEEPEWLVWALVLVLLAVGLIARTIMTGRTQPVNQGSVGLTVPADWTVMPSETPGELLRVSEPMETSLFPATVTVTQTPLTDYTDDPEVTLGDLALKWTNRLTESLLSYRVLSIEPGKVKEQDAVKVNYVYVTEPVLASPNSIPIVAEGQDVLVRQGDQLTVLSFRADADAAEAGMRSWNRILNTVELK